MQLTVNGETMILDPKEVKEAKKLALEQIRICRETIDAKTHPSFYITYLIMLHLMAQDALGSMDIQRRVVGITNQEKMR